MNIKKILGGLVGSVLMLGTIIAPAFADSYSANFENPPFTIGSISGQDGWSNAVNPAYDQGVVSNTYGYSSFGLQSFRMSDAVTSGSFGDWVFAKPLTNAVGETSATAGTFSVGTRQSHFEMQFDIASTVPTAQQPGLHVSVSPDRGDGSRMSYLRFEDGTNGIDVFFDDVQQTTPCTPASCANFVETKVGTGLDRTKTHTIKLTLDTIDGPSNDVVKVWIDGTLVHTGTSWEDYYRYDPEAAAEQSPRIVKTVIFQARGIATPADLGKGFLFDNFSMSSGPVLVGPPTTQKQCEDEGWKTFNNPTFKNQEKCEEYVESHKVTPGKADGDIRMGTNPKQRIDFTVVDAVSGPDKGNIEYWNYDYPGGVLHYKAKALCVNVDKTTKESRFMFQIPSGHPGLSGLYVVSYVKDNGTPVTSDLYGHNATGDLSTAQSWCQTGTGFSPTMYPITSGNLKVH